MKIVRFSYIAAIFALSYGLFLTASMPVEAQTVVNSEVRGIEKVFGLISNVSLTQTDSKSNQFILDILDIKGEIDALQNVQSGLKAPAVSSDSSNKVLRPNQRSNKAF